MTIILFLISSRLFGQVDVEAYEIYSTIIEEELKLRNSSKQLILIKNSTTSEHATQSMEEVTYFLKQGEPIFCSYPDKVNELIKSNPIIGTLILELELKCDSTYLLGQAFSIDMTYKLISPNKFQRILRKDQLYKIRRKDPRLFGMIEFSNVARNADFAAVYYGFHVESLNAVGAIAILKKENGKWIIISRPELWVS